MKKLLIALVLSAFVLSTAVASDSAVPSNTPQLHLANRKKSHKHHSQKKHHAQHHKQSRTRTVAIPVAPSVSAGQFYHI